jgi:hypothetical protein
VSRSSEPTLNGPLVALFALGLVALGLVLGMALGVGCSENLDSNTDRGRVCESMTAWDGMNWWLAVLSPALVLLVSQVVPWLRKHALITAVSVTVGAGALWTYLLLIVSSNIGDTR